MAVTLFLQSMPVKELVKLLGFDPKNPKSAQRNIPSFYKELRVHIDAFQKKSQDNTIPKDDPASPVAVRCATEFCESKAEIIWPQSGELPGPTWPNDQARIVKVVAWIVTWKVYGAWTQTQARRRSQERKSFIDSEGSESSSTKDIIEQEVLIMEPNVKDVSGLSFQWLRDDESSWPKLAAQKLQHLMHQTDFYQNRPFQDSQAAMERLKMLIINPLCADTELENCRDISDQVRLDERVSKEVIKITKELDRKGVLKLVAHNEQSGIFVKTKDFADRWSESTKPQTRTRRMTSIDATSYLQASLAETGGYQDDRYMNNMQRGRKKQSSPTNSELFMRSTQAAQKDKADRRSPTQSSLTTVDSVDSAESMFPEDIVLNASSRQSLASHLDDSGLGALPDPIFVSQELETSDDSTARVSPCDCKTCKFDPDDWPWKNAKVYLHSCWFRCPYCETNLSTCRSLRRHLTQSVKHRAQNIQFLDEDVSTLVTKRHSSPEFKTPIDFPERKTKIKKSSNTATLTSSETGNSDRRKRRERSPLRPPHRAIKRIAVSRTESLAPSLSSPSSTSLPYKSTSNSPRLFLTIKRPDGHFDLDPSNAIPSSDMKNSSVAEFFEIYSQKAGASVSSLEVLTFNYTFAPGNIRTIKKDDVAGWEELKQATGKLFKYSKAEDPSCLEFEIVVSCGSNKKAESVDDW